MASKLRTIGGTLTDDDMDSVELETTSVIEKARKLFQQKESHYFNFPFLHAAEVPQQTIHIQTPEVAMQMVLVSLSLIHSY